jgi:hypothetical protein
LNSTYNTDMMLMLTVLADMPTRPLSWSAASRTYKSKSDSLLLSQP